MRILDALRAAAEILEKTGIDDPLADAELLTWHAADIDRLAAFLDNPEISPQTLAKIRRLTKRRAKGEPVQYIVGHVEFCGLKIAVGKGVLIPRPETELLVEESIKIIHAGAGVKSQAPRAKSLPAAENTARRLQPAPAVLDLCTGTGCIALSLAKEFPKAQIIATDISADALQYAKKNASANGITNVTFRKGSLFQAVTGGEKFELITANPPYIIKSEIPELQSEVKDWEPHSALDGGRDGLDFYREIVGSAGAYLQPGGSLILELGFGQAEAVVDIAGRNGFSVMKVLDDLSGIRRVLTCCRCRPPRCS